MRVEFNLKTASIMFWLAVSPVIILRFTLGAFLINFGKDLTDFDKSAILIGLGIYFALSGATTGMRAVKKYSALREQLKEIVNNVD
jgi:hypothetical protein